MRFYGVDYIREAAGEPEFVVACLGDDLRLESLSTITSSAALVLAIQTAGSSWWGLNLALGLPASYVDQPGLAGLYHFAERCQNAAAFRERCSQRGARHGTRELLRGCEQQAHRTEAVNSQTRFEKNHLALSELIAPLANNTVIRLLPWQSPQHHRPNVLEVCPEKLRKAKGLPSPRATDPADSDSDDPAERVLDWLEQEGLQLDPAERERILSDRRGVLLAALLCAWSSMLSARHPKLESFIKKAHPTEGLIGPPLKLPRVKAPLSRRRRILKTAGRRMWLGVSWLILIGILGSIGAYVWMFREYSFPEIDSRTRTSQLSVHNVKLEPEYLEQRESPSGTPFKLNNSSAAYEADVSAPPNLIFTNFADAVQAARERGEQVLPSVDVVHAKCKVFNDQLVWRLEEFLQSRRQPMNKRAALQRLVERVDDRQAYLYLATAQHLGGAPADQRLGLGATIEQRATAFKSGVLRPLGAWNDSEAQRQIFWQDRYLMANELDVPPEHFVVGASMEALVQVIAEDPELDTFFRFMDQLDTRRCNPPERSGTYSELVRNPAAAAQARLAVRLVAQRQSPEARLLRLVQFNSAESFVDGLAGALRKGDLSLEPTKASGWYDYQLFALETLLLPERAHETHKLLLSDAYQEHYREQFKAAFTADRETHVKLLYRPTIGGRIGLSEPEQVTIAPAFPVEPAATVYLRLAHAYRFLQDGLAELGAFDVALFDSIQTQSELLYGLVDLLQANLGYVERLEDPWFDAARARQRAENWLETWQEDPLLAPDVRTAIPMLDSGTGPVHHFAIAGVALTPARYNWHEDAPPVPDGNIDPTLEAQEVMLPTRVFVDFSKDGALLTRSAFRDEIGGMGLREIRKAFPKDGGGRMGIAVPPLRLIGMPLLAVLLPLGLVIGVRKRGVNWTVRHGVGALCALVILCVVFPPLKWRVILNVAASNGNLATLMDFDFNHLHYVGVRDTKALVGCLDSRDDQIAYLAATTLGSSRWIEKSKTVVPTRTQEAVLKALEQPGRTAMKVELIWYSSGNFPQKLRPILRDMLQKQPRLRDVAFRSLCRIGDPADRNILLQAIRERRVSDTSELRLSYTDRATALTIATMLEPRDYFNSRAMSLSWILGKNPEALTEAERNTYLPDILRSFLEKTGILYLPILKEIPDPQLRAPFENKILSQNNLRGDEFEWITERLEAGEFDRVKACLRRVAANKEDKYDAAKALRLLQEYGPK